METSDKDQRQRGYVKKFYDRRKEAGETRVSLWLKPEGTEALDYLISRTPGMSKSDIVDRALRYLALRAKLDERQLEEALKGTAEIPAP